MNTNILLILQFANAFTSAVNAGLAAALPPWPYKTLVVLIVGAFNVALGVMLQQIGNQTQPKKSS